MTVIRRRRLCAAVVAALLPAALPALAQDAPSTDSGKAKTLDRVTVTGSRIKQTGRVTSAPVAVITHETLERSGATSVGAFLQEISASGKALNAKFNSSGNFGYPSDGGGIGAGSAQVDLRNLGSSRVLVLVDGLRWVNESSASGVSGSADLNTIPLAIVDRIEVLEDGASAIYGSDAIAGVVNIITKKNFDGALLHEKYGSYGHGGTDEEADITIGGGSDRFRGVLNAAYVKSKGISSAAWNQSSMPVPGAGLAAGSSGTPQGRYIFCDPTILVPGTYGYCDAQGNDWFDITLNNGTTVPNYNGGNPIGGNGTYHNFSGADRFNFAPYNLLLTPSERKSLFGSMTYDINDSVSLHGKVLYNQRQSANQAAPEPIFVGPFAGTGGIADGITISASNPYNPFGINLCAVADPLNGCPVANLGFITKRPIELGPRVFTQDVKTWYVNFGLDGNFDVGNGLSWNLDFVHSENQADQMFTNGFNVLKLKEALGPAYQDAGGVWRCGTPTVTIPNCVPLNLFGGEGTPIAPNMLAFISTPQHDSSKQVLDIITANLEGDLWAMGGDRHAAFAVGYEHRRYGGDFNPDPLRQDGESQDSFASPISASYNVDEAYGELRLPWAKSFSTDFALRYSDYSTFGSTVTGKAGFLWKPSDDFVLRGTYSTGFRAPNLGELYGLTQFGATLVDPCNAVTPGGAPASQYAAACTAAGVPNGFQQANTQIITFTGGNALLKPEKSKNYNLGAVWSPSFAENTSWSSKLDFEVDYFHYKINDAIQAPDIQQLLNACYSGSAQGSVCSGFTRGLGSQLNPPTDFLSNLGQITTSGVDLKVNWVGPSTAWGQPSASLQSTHAIGYRAVDKDGNVAQRGVGIEVNDSSIPSWKTNLQLGWKVGDWQASWNLRYVASVKESCGNAVATPAVGCPTGDGWHRLGSATYSDVQLSWDNAFTAKGLKLSVGANNVFAREAPSCVSCSLNGYDAGTYDLPFRFVYAEVNWKF